MKGDRIYYRRGYKYQLTRDYSCFTGILLPHDVHGDFYTLTADGWCHLYKGFPSDGPSSLTIDTKNSMRGAFIHDAYCYATNDRLVEYDVVSPHHHDQLRAICIEDGMWEFRADRWHDAVIIGRGGDPENGDDYPELSAP